MNLLPIATPTAPAGGVGSEDPATAGSGDFTALLAMLVGAASTTLSIDTPSLASGDTTGAEDAPSAFPAPMSATVETLPTPDLAALAAIEPSIAPTTGTTAAPVPEMPAAPLDDAPSAPLADMPVTPPADVPIATVGSPDATGAEPIAPATEAPRSPRDVAHRAQPGEPAVRAQPAVSAHRAEPSRPADTPPARPVEHAVPAQPVVPAQPAAPAPRAERAVPAQPADAGEPTHGAEPAVPAPGEPGTPVTPARTPEQHERRPETMTLPDAAHFERPPLGNPASPGHDPAHHHNPDDSHEPVTAMPALDRLPVEDPVADHLDGGPAPKAADRPAAPASSPAAPTQVVPLVAANRSNTLAPVDGPTPAPPAAATVPEQIVSAVVPLHGRGDGRHEVTLELRPDDLGTIRVEVAVEHQTVHLTLHAAEPATSRLLSAALPDLRSALADAGLTAGQVGVGLDGGGSAGQRRSRPQIASEPRLPDTGTSTSTSTIRTLRPAAAGRLDLFL